MTQYGGDLRNVYELEVGTRFFVHNGIWNGEVVEVGGVKHIAVIHYDQIDIVPNNGITELEITVMEVAK